MDFSLFAGFNLKKKRIVAVKLRLEVLESPWKNYRMENITGVEKMLFLIINNYN